MGADGLFVLFLFIFIKRKKDKAVGGLWMSPPNNATQGSG